MKKKIKQILLYPPLLAIVCYEFLFMLSNLVNRLLGIEFMNFVAPLLSGLAMWISYSVGRMNWLDKWWITHILEFLILVAVWEILKKKKPILMAGGLVLFVAANALAVWRLL
jgi:hypothetical protein